ncbi:MAG: sugar ABC transporter substrate-binding protein [Planctomycetota bacterium]|jgi:ribose transport system permease protein|nr:sugar ABC transporter substrate-binding protein [Planctomycetota bacterium]
MRRLLVLGSAALLLGCLTAAWGGERKYRLALVLKSLTNPAIKNIADGAQAEADKYGVELTILSSQGFSALEEQINQVEDVMRRQVDVIGIQAVDSKGIIPVIEEANAKNVPIISVDTGADGGKVLTYISTDNREAGQAAGEWLVRQVGEGKVAMIEGTPGSQQGRERKEGFHAAIQAQAKVQLVSSIAANFERVKGMEIMEDILTANPDLKGVFCANDEMALGALETLRQRNAIGKVIVIGMNGAPDALLAAYNGEIQATVVQYTDFMGASFVRLAVEYLDSKGSLAFPLFYNTGYGIADTKFLRKMFGSFGLVPALK